MSDKIPDDVLAHYGIKGMKWGVTRQRGSNGRVESEDHIESRKLMGKAQRELSTNELKKVNDRLNTEKLNNELQSRTALQKIKKGTATAGIILAAAGTITAAYNFATSPAVKAGIQAYKNLK